MSRTLGLLSMILWLPACWAAPMFQGRPATLEPTLTQGQVESAASPELQARVEKAKALVQQAQAAEGAVERIKLLEEAVRACPEADVPHGMLAVEYLEVGDRPKALAEITAAIHIAPQSAFHRLVEGNVLLQISGFGAAGKSYSAALERSSGDHVLPADVVEETKRLVGLCSHVSPLPNADDYREKLAGVSSARAAALGSNTSSEVRTSVAPEAADATTEYSVVAEIAGSISDAITSAAPDSEKVLLLKAANDLFLLARGDSSDESKRGFGRPTKDVLLGLVMDLAYYAMRDDPTISQGVRQALGLWSAGKSKEEMIAIAQGLSDDGAPASLGSPSVGLIDHWAIKDSGTDMPRLNGVYEYTFDNDPNGIGVSIIEMIEQQGVLKVRWLDPGRWAASELRSGKVFVGTIRGRIGSFDCETQYGYDKYRFSFSPDFSTFTLIVDSLYKVGNRKVVDRCKGHLRR